MSRSVLSLCVLVAGLAISAQADASDYPNKPITFVVPQQAGSTTDVIGRTVSKKLSEVIGQPVVIENKPGAAGAIGVTAVIRSAPDGYTLWVGFQNNITLAPQVTKAAVDPLTKLVPVALVGDLVQVLAIHPSIPAKNIAELIAYAKQHPDTLNFGTPGPGSSHALVAEFLRRAGAPIVSVHYTSIPQIVLDAVAGRMHMAFAASPIPFVRSKQLRAVAIDGIEESPEFPGVISFKKQGYDWPLSDFALIAAPEGTPPDVIEKLRKALATTLADPAVIAGLKHVMITVPPKQPSSDEIMRSLRKLADAYRPFLATAK